MKRVAKSDETYAAATAQCQLADPQPVGTVKHTSLKALIGHYNFALSMKLKGT